MNLDYINEAFVKIKVQFNIKVLDVLFVNKTLDEIKGKGYEFAKFGRETSKLKSDILKQLNLQNKDLRFKEIYLTKELIEKNYLKDLIWMNRIISLNIDIKILRKF